jgi:DNA-3-methyladenine glycosylase I
MVRPAVVVGDDGLARCPWADSDPLSRQYHDTEWGLSVHGDQALLERITLEAFQSGLSWLTILRKRPAFRAAFRDFDPDLVARFDDSDVERLMGDAEIVRNRGKVLAAITNARATVVLRSEGGLDRLVWSYVPRRKRRAPRTPADVPSRTPESEALAAQLRAHGFAFVGPTTVYATMQAIGVVDDHLLGCHRRGLAEAN